MKVYAETGSTTSGGSGGATGKKGGQKAAPKKSATRNQIGRNAAGNTKNAPISRVGIAGEGNRR